jgi:hypothetical protein
MRVLAPILAVALGTIVFTFVQWAFGTLNMILAAATQAQP